MKNFKFLALLLFLVGGVFGQGTFEFRAPLTPLPSAPAGTPTGVASFYIFSDSITGLASSGENNVAISFARVELANGQLVADTRNFSPTCANQGSVCVWTAYWFLENDAAKADQLLSGEWYVTLGLEGGADRIIRGQLELVPEPSTWMFYGLGAVFVLFFNRRKSG